MKKLMFAAAVAASMVALADSSIVSQNIVGYAQNDMNLDGKITLVSSQFFGVGGAGGNFSINDIKCGDEASEMVALSTLDENGQLLDQYMWTAEDGWFDLTGESAGTYKPGTAFWVQCDLKTGTPKIQSSGEVGTSDIEMQLNGGSLITLVGNGYPVDISINDILCSDNGNEMVGLNTLDEDGQLKDQYMWTKEDGWVDLTGGEGAGTYKPGTAFWVQCDLPAEQGVVVLTLPGVEL